MEIAEIAREKLYSDLTSTLVNARIAVPRAEQRPECGTQSKDVAFGWARESNIIAPSSMNTSEVVLGLLAVGNVFARGRLSQEIASSIRGGVAFLLDHQKSTGGWTTSMYEKDANAEGNIITTALAVWCLAEYAQTLPRREAATLENAMRDAGRFFSDCKGDNCYRFRPQTSHGTHFSTIYALMGYVNVALYYDLIDDRDRKESVCATINAILRGIPFSEYDGFHYVMLLLALKRIRKYGLIASKEFDDAFSRTEENVKNLSLHDCVAPHEERRWVEEGKGGENKYTTFSYFTPIWVLASMSYAEATPNENKKALLAHIYNQYLRSDAEEVIRVYVSEREWVWATAQTLMALSMFASTQTIADFFNFTEKEIAADVEATSDKKSNQNNQPTVFVVYGRNTVFKNSMAEFLEALGVRPVFYDNSNGDATSTYEAFTKCIRDTDATLVLLTGDDEGRLRKEYLKESTQPGKDKIMSARPRMNVIFEAGYSYALENQKTLLIKVGEVELPSDILMINTINVKLNKRGEIDEAAGARAKAQIAGALKNCGIAINQQPESLEKKLRTK